VGPEQRGEPAPVGLVGVALPGAQQLRGRPGKTGGGYAASVW
jgi:hypothetical protein